MSEDYESVAMSIGVKGELIRTSPHLTDFKHVMHIREYNYWLHEVLYYL